MTKKDYFVLAIWMQEVGRIVPASIQKDICETLCKTLKWDNHRFDADTFKTACGVQQ